MTRLLAAIGGLSIASLVALGMLLILEVFLEAFDYSDSKLADGGKPYVLAEVAKRVS